MKGVPLRTVQELGGWKSIKMVERYAHLSEEHKEAAVELILPRGIAAGLKKVLETPLAFDGIILAWPGC